MFIWVFDFLFYFINLFFVKCCLNYVAGYVYFQFATCGGFKACATKGLHFPLVKLSTCLVSIEVFFVQDTGNLLDMAACVSQPFFCSKIKGWNPTIFLLQNKRLKCTTSNTDFLPLLPLTLIFFFLPHRSLLLLLLQLLDL